MAGQPPLVRPPVEVAGLSALVIAAVIVAILGPTIKRASNLANPPYIAIPVALIAAAMPCLMAYLVLNPGPALDEADISPLAQEVILQVPPASALLVTANLTENPGGPQAGKSNYALAMSGQGWASKATGEIRRKVEDDDDDKVDINVLEGSQISESGKRGAGNWGEDLEERFTLKGDGHVKVELTNFDGDAANGLHLRVIKAPPPAWLLWPFALLLGAIGLTIELRRGPSQLGVDIAFLALLRVPRAEGDE